MKRKEKQESYVISFRVGAEVYKKITQYAQNQRDDAGIALKAPAAARRLVVKALGQSGPFGPRNHK